jgi:hypothetical protein
MHGYLGGHVDDVTTPKYLSLANKFILSPHPSPQYIATLWSGSHKASKAYDSIQPTQKVKKSAAAQ